MERLTKEQEKQFEALSRPLIKWLNDNCHPHTRIVVENNGAEIMEGVRSFRTNEYILG